MPAGMEAFVTVPLAFKHTYCCISFEKVSEYGIHTFMSWYFALADLNMGRNVEAIASSDDSTISARSRARTVREYIGIVRNGFCCVEEWVVGLYVRKNNM